MHILKVAFTVFTIAVLAWGAWKATGHASPFPNDREKYDK